MSTPSEPKRDKPQPKPDDSAAPLHPLVAKVVPDPDQPRIRSWCSGTSGRLGRGERSTAESTWIQASEPITKFTKTMFATPRRRILPRTISRPGFSSRRPRSCRSSRRWTRHFCAAPLRLRTPWDRRENHSCIRSRRISVISSSASSAVALHTPTAVYPVGCHIRTDAGTVVFCIHPDVWSVRYRLHTVGTVPMEIRFVRGGECCTPLMAAMRAECRTLAMAARLAECRIPAMAA